MTDEPWAYIDTLLYWEKGLNKVGEYGKVDFLSDAPVRRLTINYRNDMLPDRYYIIRVQSKIQKDAVYALYDDLDHTVLFDCSSLEQFLFQMDAFKTYDDCDDIVVMAKKRLRTKKE